MKIALYIILPLFCAAIAGCSTTWTSTSGRDFDAAKIAEIKKGVTTAAELVVMFGQPYSKSVKTENDVEWTYSWVKASSTTSSGWSVENIRTTGQKKHLSVLVRNDVVVNYSYDEGPFELNTKHELNYSSDRPVAAAPTKAH